MRDYLHGDLAAADATVIAAQNQLSIMGSLSMGDGKCTALEWARWASLIDLT